MPEIRYYMAVAAYCNKKYDEAAGHINAYLASPRLQLAAKETGENLRQQINYARYDFSYPVRAGMHDSGDTINSLFAAKKKTNIENTSSAPLYAQTKKSGTITTVITSTSTKENAFLLWNSDGFAPHNTIQRKMMMNAFRYGNINCDSLQFRVQMLTFKDNTNQFFRN